MIGSIVLSSVASSVENEDSLLAYDSDKINILSVEMYISKRALVSLPFLSDLHTEVSGSWRHP